MVAPLWQSAFEAKIPITFGAASRQLKADSPQLVCIATHVASLYAFVLPSRGIGAGTNLGNDESASNAADEGCTSKRQSESQFVHAGWFSTEQDGPNMASTSSSQRPGLVVCRLWNLY